MFIRMSTINFYDNVQLCYFWMGIFETVFFSGFFRCFDIFLACMNYLFYFFFPQCIAIVLSFQSSKDVLDKVL